jgi:hypothetical protein
LVWLVFLSSPSIPWGLTSIPVSFAGHRPKLILSCQLILPIPSKKRTHASHQQEKAHCVVSNFRTNTVWIVRTALYFWCSLLNCSGNLLSPHEKPISMCWLQDCSRSIGAKAPCIRTVLPSGLESCTTRWTRYMSWVATIAVTWSISEQVMLIYRESSSSFLFQGRSSRSGPA